MLQKNLQAEKRISSWKKIKMKENHKCIGLKKKLKFLNYRLKIQKNKNKRLIDLLKC